MVSRRSASRLARAPHSWAVLPLAADGPRRASVAMVPSTQFGRHDVHHVNLREGVIADFVDTA